MFEKEAEEYLFDRLDPKAIDSVSEFSNKSIEAAIVSSFKDGAEFGYNKGKEDVKTTILKLRNCMNCKHRDTRGHSSCKDKGIVLCSHWEMKE